jgi:hypothetical protein
MADDQGQCDANGDRHGVRTGGYTACWLLDLSLLLTTHHTHARDVHQADLVVLPISAWCGENVVYPPSLLPWCGHSATPFRPRDSTLSML